MLAAAAVYLRLKHAVGCAKLHHQNKLRCIFCEYHAAAPPNLNPNPTLNLTLINTPLQRVQINKPYSPPLLGGEGRGEGERFIPSHSRNQCRDAQYRRS